MRPLALGWHIGLRQIKGERAARAGCADQANLPAEQPGQFAADRQPKACAAVFAAGAAVGLLKGLEDDLLLVRCDANAGVTHRERQHGFGAVKRRVVGTPALAGRRDRQGDFASLSEFECIGEQILKDLLQPLGIGVNSARQTSSQFHIEGQFPRLSHVPEGPLHVVLQIPEGHLARVHDHRARFDLG